MNDTSLLHTHRTIVDRLRHWCERKPHAPAYTFLKEHGRFDRMLTFAALHDAVCARTADLLTRELESQRVMILLPPGLDYVVNFLACLAAGAIAVPVFPPSTRRDWDKIDAIARNAKPKAAIATRKDMATLSEALEALPGLNPSSCMLIDGQGADTPEPRSIVLSRDLDPDRIAFLQYTSGSTGQPKGVMVSHANILHNAAQQAQAMGSDEDAVFVSWLPLYHDMGLIGIVLQALSVGAHADPASRVARRPGS